MRDDEATRKLRDETGATRTLARFGFRAGDELSGGRYVLGRRLGHGGMSTVWLARDTRLDRPVAVKILSDALASDAEYLERFDREARIAAGLSHPNLVSIYDFEAGERPYLVMEYVEGGDLAARLKATTAPDPGTLARELLSALEHIHAAGVIHRDIKPKNILIGGDGRALLTDFGIARPSDATALTRTGLVMGTGDYIAPEVLAGEPSTECSDLYALGVTLGHVAEQHRADRRLRKLISQLREADPGKRPASAGAALAKLSSSPFSHGPPPVNPVEPSGRPPTVARATDDRLLGDGVVALPAPGASPEPTPLVAGSAQRGGGEEPRRRSRLPAPSAAAVLAILAIAFVALAIVIDSTGGGEEVASEPPAQSGGSEVEGAERSGGGGGGGDGSGSDTQPVDAASPSGAELNDQGYALIQAGQPGEAVPLLQRAVETLEGSGDITYAYALYNLGWALRLAGRPEEAIPILEQRLEIPNQTGTVRRELEAARADAGLEPERGRGRGRGNDKDDD